MPPPFSRNISNVFAEQEIKFIPESPERGNVCFLVIFHENECVYSVIARKSNSAPFQGKSETSQTVQTKEVAIDPGSFIHTLDTSSVTIFIDTDSDKDSDSSAVAAAST